MKLQQAAESVWFSLAHKLLPLTAFLVFAVPGGILIEFLRSKNISGAENYGGIIILLGIPAAVFVKFVLYVMRGNGGLSFMEASSEVFYSWMLYLHFIPIVGPILSRWAEARKARVNPFTAKNED